MNLLEPEDVFAPASPDTLMRGVMIADAGVYRLARRDCEFYSIMITSAGAWGRARVTNGKGRSLWHQPSAFTGSFVLSMGAEAGLVLELYGERGAPTVSINWREPDAA